jgi:RNA polymerase sigma-70 factor (sigma-E family)
VGVEAIRLPDQRSSGTPTAVEDGAAAPQLPPSLSELYQGHRLSLVRLAVLLVDDVATAEDVVQDAFAALHARWRGLRGEAAALRYLRVTVLNMARSALRRRRTVRRWLAGQRAAEPVDGHEWLAVEHRTVIDALRQLAPRQREVLVLRYWLDLSEAQIAETLGISRGSVKSTASRALDVMEKLLEDTP